MRAVVQRVTEASVSVEGTVVSQISAGLLVLLGVEVGDTSREAEYLAQKIIELRIFADDKFGMNRSVQDINGELLVVSQFTLMGDCRKGRRPNFVNAASPEIGRSLYEHFIQKVKDRGIPVKAGVFGAMMKIHLINDGPVTLILESRRWLGDRVSIV